VYERGEGRFFEANVKKTAGVGLLVGGRANRNFPHAANVASEG
jgi:hypothetical protein